MQINLSEEIIKTVCIALRTEKSHLECLLRFVECGKAAKEKEEEFKSKLAEVEETLQVFEELLQ